MAQTKFASGFASSMARFYGRPKIKAPAPMTDDEKRRIIKRYIERFGVTHCPTRLATGYEGHLYGAHLV